MEYQRYRGWRGGSRREREGGEKREGEETFMNDSWSDRPFPFTLNNEQKHTNQSIITPTYRTTLGQSQTHAKKPTVCNTAQISPFGHAMLSNLQPKHVTHSGMLSANLSPNFRCGFSSCIFGLVDARLSGPKLVFAHSLPSRVSSGEGRIYMCVCVLLCAERRSGCEPRN